MEYRIGRVLLSEEELRRNVKELGSRIREDYKGKKVVFVCVLKGAVIFFSDLVREIGPDVDAQLDFLAISSYGVSTKSSGVVKIQKDLSTDIHGKHVIIVEDILDTGLSLSYIGKLLRERGPESLEICVLLDKAERRTQHVDVKYTGFTIPDEFVIGYGLDYAGQFRHLPAVHIAEPLD